MSDQELWGTWAAMVVDLLAMPRSPVSADTLWAWSNAETAPYPLMRWNNPLNTTEPWPGARNSGSQPGPHDVKIYATLADGADATAYTLTQEPYYPAILANLRAGLPRQQWGSGSAAAAQLKAWGTGSAWLTVTYPPIPLFSGAGSVLNPDQPIPDFRRTKILATATGLHAFVRGVADASGNRALVHRRHDGTSWGSWQNLGGNLGSDRIEVGIDKKGAIHVVVTGVPSGLFETVSADDGATWSGFKDLQGAGDELVLISATSPDLLAAIAAIPGGTVDLAPILQAAQQAAAAALAAQTAAQAAQATTAKIEAALQKSGTALTQA